MNVGAGFRRRIVKSVQKGPVLVRFYPLGPKSIYVHRGTFIKVYVFTYSLAMSYGGNGSFNEMEIHPAPS